MLSRGGSTPLKLRIEWPLDQERLRIILSCTRKIQSLVINTTNSNEPCDARAFSVLNLSSLQHLNVATSDHKTMEDFMDIGLRSSSQQMTLAVDSGELFIDRLLRHRLMERIVELSVATSQ
jgi:hypothetical protein